MPNHYFQVDENVQESRSLNEQIMEKEEIHQNQLEILKREKDEEHSKLAAEVGQNACILHHSSFLILTLPEI